MKRSARFWQTSLAARLAFHFLLLSLVTVLLLGTVAYLGEVRAVRAAVFGRLEVEATLKADALAHWVQEEAREFELFGELDAIRAMVTALVSLEPGTTEYQANHQRVEQSFQKLVGDKNGWRELQILSGEAGEVLYSTNKEHEKDYRTRDAYFMEGSQGFYVSKIYAAVPSYTPTLTFSQPIRAGDAGDAEAGVLALHLDLARLDQILESTGLGEDGESYLVDRVNVLVSGRRFGNADYRRGVHSFGIDEAIEGRDGKAIYTSYRGVEVLGVYRMVDTFGAALLVEIPEVVALAPARNLLLIISAIGLAVACALAIVTFVLSEQIAGPVLAVRDAAVKIAQGDLESRAPVTTYDEIGTLARAFNRMAEHNGALIRELQARNDELSRYTYTVSHDLRSPLVTIQGFLGFLEKDVQTGNHAGVHDDLARINAAAKKMQQLLDELLELSRVGRMVNPSEEISLGELVAEVLESTWGYADARNIRIRVQEDLPFVYGDRVRIFEVFQNLVENAARFMGDQSAPCIEIGAERREDDVLCFVRDNGIGIDPQYHQRIFGLFERLDADTEGTGIGLALVKGIVEHHGGSIWVDSDGLGQGTTFYWTLPHPQGTVPIEPQEAQ